MDPLHPLVPIQPASPTRPDYNRVQRIARDQQREAAPDWQRSPDEDADEEKREEQFDDDYDPDWSDRAAAEAYNDHGVLNEHAADPPAIDPSAPAGAEWDPRRQGELRSPRPPADDPEDDGPGPHIDIIV